MPSVTVISVGKIKEKFFKDALSEYEKRLSRFCKLKFIEIPDRPIPNGASPAEEREVLEKEGEDILACLKKDSYIITLCIEGSPLSSTELADKISDAFMQSGSITFVIGGSLGLSEEVKKKSRFRLSMSKLTFPHNLAKVMLTEQIYRAFKIINNETYHK